MTPITGEIVTGAPADAVFGFAADQRNEPGLQPAHGAIREGHAGAAAVVMGRPVHLAAAAVGTGPRPGGRTAAVLVLPEVTAHYL